MKCELKGLDKIRYALSRLEWADTQFRIWRVHYTSSGLSHLIPRLKIKYKLEGLINHDRVLHNRIQH